MSDNLCLMYGLSEWTITQCNHCFWDEIKTYNILTHTHTRTNPGKISAKHTVQLFHYSFTECGQFTPYTLRETVTHRKTLVTI